MNDEIFKHLKKLPAELKTLICKYHTEIHIYKEYRKKMLSVNIPLFFATYYTCDDGSMYTKFY